MKERAEDKFILRWAKRLRATELLGGKCYKCGETNIFFLEFHHLNPDEKEYGLCQIKAHVPWETIEAEAKKCRLLCKHCHTKEHREDTINQYNKLIDKIKEKSKVVDKISRPPLDKDYIYQLLKKKMSLCSIAKLLNKEESAILVVAKKLEIEKGEKLYLRLGEYNKTKEKVKKDKLLIMYNNGISLKEICSYFNSTIGAVARGLQILRKNGLINGYRPRGKNKINKVENNT